MSKTPHPLEMTDDEIEEFWNKQGVQSVRREISAGRSWGVWDYFIAGCLVMLSLAAVFAVYEMWFA